MKNYAEQTNYPQLFRRTYWGSFAGECDSVIIANRNAMVEQFGIVRIAKQRTVGWLEHQEVYASLKGLKAHIVLFDSRYDGLDMVPLGFEITDPIYSAQTITWVRAFFNIYNYGRWIKSLDKQKNMRGE